MIQFDTASSMQSATTGDLTWSHTCSGADRILFVGVKYLTTSNILDVTYNGESLGLFDNATIGTETLGFYWLDDPSLGTHTVEITFNIAVAVLAASASYFNRRDYDIETADSSVGPATSFTFTNPLNSGNNNWFIGAGYAGGGSLVAGANTVMRTTGVTQLAIFDTNKPISEGQPAQLTFTFASSTVILASGVTLKPDFTNVGNYPPYIQVGSGMSRNERAT